MSQSSSSVLPLSESYEDEDEKEVEIEATPRKQFVITATRLSWPAKTALAFFIFVALGISTLTTEMKFIPRWVSFDPSCSPATLDVTNIKYRSDHRFYAIIKDMAAMRPPTLRGEHQVLCTDDHAEVRKFEYCLPITSQDDPMLCADADRVDLLVRQSPSTLCRVSVMHLLVADAFEELKAAGLSPVVNFSSPNGGSSTADMLTGFSTIAYNGIISRGDAIIENALRLKGYHLFQDNENWKMCVAPTHPLASYLYDPGCKISASGSSVPHVAFVGTSTGESANHAPVPEVVKPNLNFDDSCSPDMVNANDVEYGPNNRFYAILQEMGSLPVPAFYGPHKVLCSDIDRRDRGYRYCLPITGRKDVSFCTGADRMELLAHQSSSKRCYASILHMLLTDVYSELEATGSNPVLTFGTLLGAIRNGSMIPFTEDVDIAYAGTIASGGALDEALWKKGYHLFDYGIWRVCVAPTHPLASHLYDPDAPLARDYKIPYVDLYGMAKKSDDDSWTMQEFKELIPGNRVEPFSQVSINGVLFDTVHDPKHFLEQEYGDDYLKPKPRRPKEAFPEAKTKKRKTAQAVAGKTSQSFTLNNMLLQLSSFNRIRVVKTPSSEDHKAHKGWGDHRNGDNVANGGMSIVDSCSMRRWLTDFAVVAFFLVGPTMGSNSSYSTKSGILPRVGPSTPDSAQTYTTSRGETWTLTMSDEFNTAGRSFEAGDDHLWTALEKADGVNSALEVYSVNMTSTEGDADDNCYFFINVTDETIAETVWSDYISPAGYETVYFYYRSGMVQSWNKFCFQGGMIEVHAQLPGAVTNESGNPDVSTGSTTVRAANIDYYPTWPGEKYSIPFALVSLRIAVNLFLTFVLSPSFVRQLTPVLPMLCMLVCNLCFPGIWLMGNLGRAISSASTSRTWPYTYNECNETIFSSQNQRISACDDNPGSGLNANQGRGAPEIDILEGGSTAISTSLQVGPGMPEDFRRITDNSSDPGTRVFATAPITLCDVDEDDVQSYATVNASIAAGITDNACTMDICPGSYDPNSDLGYMNTGVHWGINANGTCFPKMNQYAGAYLCSAGNTASECTASSGSTSADSEFAYQMDAISANWEIHMAAYLDWVTYSVEWVMGDEGYIRWEIEGQPIFEVTADVLTNPPQDTAQMNPKKIMIEEPMYIVFNVALSSSWGSSPPNAGEGSCRGDGSSSTDNAICDSFPMYLKIDYVRLYQDISDDTDMAIGCDPDTHPTKQWIEDNIDDDIDDDNPDTAVSGMAFCDSNADCTISTTGTVTGACSDGRCKCKSSSWTGPRCTETASESFDSSDSDDTSDVYGPPMYASLIAASVTVLCTTCTLTYSFVMAKHDATQLQKQHVLKMRSTVKDAYGPMSELAVKGNYSTNFV
ncbi:unnamed protein product [Phytophthora fragariaefolia]|uniref:Unnamed protein product n=1 Tax=Phytophthora fragariaefolia TaxID=1490495 RepID=A0A9W6U002_9STRA|nr:unnamed protein product [Phytophthora fragariaefolia]